MPGFMAVILIGVAVGFVARLVYPGPNTPHGFILTTVLGECGAVLATFIGRFVGSLASNELADPIRMVVGAMIVLFIWNQLAAYDFVTDPGMHHHRKKKLPPRKATLQQQIEGSTP